MGPIWIRQDPGGPHVGPMNFAIWDRLEVLLWIRSAPSRRSSPTVAIFYFEPIGTAVRWGSHTMALIQVTSYWPPATFALVRRPIPMFWYVQNICRDPADQTIFLLSHTEQRINSCQFLSIHISSWYIRIMISVGLGHTNRDNMNQDWDKDIENQLFNYRRLVYYSPMPQPPWRLNLWHELVIHTAEKNKNYAVTVNTFPC